MLRLPLAGLPLVSSAATYPVGSSSENWRQRESSAATSIERSTMSVWTLSLASARELVERKHAAMGAFARDVQYRRLAGLLGRRGFDTAVITRVLADVLGE